MKKLLVLVVVAAVAVAFAAYAGTTTTAKEVKNPATTEKVDVKTNPATQEVKGKVETEYKKGPVYEDTVTFDKFDKNSDYIYVVKDQKVMRLKHTLTESDKQDMLQKKKGDKVTITSTYPLTKPELAVIIKAK